MTSADIIKNSITKIGSRIPIGTSGSILFVDSNGKLAQNNSNLFWDAANNRLGIRTASPSYGIHMVGANSANALFAIDHIEDTAGNPGVLFRKARGTVSVPTDVQNGDDVGFIGSTSYSNGWSGTSRIFFSIDGTFTTGQRPPSRIAFWTNEANGSLTERVRIDKSGNVGIGTTLPLALLDINSDILRLRTAKTPATAGATGNQGDICWDADYVYVCTATNTWKRAAIATW